MRVRRIQPGEAIAAARGDAVVCIPMSSESEHFVRCLRSVLANTPEDVPVLVCDNTGAETDPSEQIRRLERVAEGHRELLYRRRDPHAPLTLNDAFDGSAPADVVVLNADCLVFEGWLAGLRAAAYSDSTIATASALSSDETTVSVGQRGVPVPHLWPESTFQDAAAAVRSRSPRLLPRLLTAVGDCIYVRRMALELIGNFDPALSPGYDQRADFSQRCIRAGLAHVAADDVVAFQPGGRRNGCDTLQPPGQLLAIRHPYFHEALRAFEEDTAGPLARSLSAVRRTLKGLGVVIDARILAGPMTGTQLHVLELIAALSGTGEARMTAIVPPTLDPRAKQELEALDNVECVVIDPASRSVSVERADVFHRPFQVNSHSDLSLGARLGERLILTQQDLIAYRNPSYFRSSDGWEGYRRLTRRALAVADRVVFFSAHARRDVLAEDLVEPDRASVVKIGVDHTVSRAIVSPTPPVGAARLPSSAEMMLCLGTDFRHKNRLFALRMLEQLQRRHDWEGVLVLAGPPVTQGSSIGDERELLSLHPRVAQAVVEFAAVSAAEKAWLMRRAALVLYPTVYEGFGLIPFEAADNRVPCLWAPGTSLSEILPDAAAEIVPWDPAASADQALGLMRDRQARESNLAAIDQAGSTLTWEATASALLEIYHRTCDGPATPPGALERRHGGMRSGWSEDAIRLIGPNGALPTDLERPLLALATHSRVGAPLFSAVKMGYRVSYRLRRRHSSPKPLLADALDPETMGEVGRPPS